MTAINVFRHSDSVVVMTDAAHYDLDGTVKRIGEKSLAYPGLNAVFAVRGKSHFFDAVEDAELSRLRTFDALLASAPSLFQQIARQESVETRQEIVLAGWSESRDRGESYVMFSQDHKIGSDAPIVVPAFKLQALPQFVAAPAPSAQNLAAQGMYGLPAGGRIDPKTHGVQIMQSQRLQLGDYPYSTVGGYARAHTINRMGVVSEIVHMWNDVLGQQIRVNAVVGFPVGSNRRQRRAQGRH